MREEPQNGGRIQGDIIYLAAHQPNRGFNKEGLIIVSKELFY
jgi:hypothetical protein